MVKDPLAKSAAQTRYLMKLRYGITFEEYSTLLETQGGVCGICGQAPTGAGRNSGRLNVDHDHATGKVRGLLCPRCNGGMGSLGDDPILLRRAADWIESNKMVEV